MSWHKLTTTVTISTDDLSALESTAEMICDVTEAILNGVPESTVETFDQVSYELADPEGPDECLTTTVSEYGNSLAVNVTKLKDRMGLKKGDKVALTIRKINGGRE